jgi:hypothetical protein
MDETEGTPEWWMGKALEEALAGARAAAESATDGKRAWEEAATLVEQLAAVVTKGHESAIRTSQAADHAKTCVVGAYVQWELLKPRLRHFRFLIEGGKGSQLGENHPTN